MPHIFLVDPFPDEREMYAEFFAVSGFQVSTFEKSDAVVEAATTQRPDAIVTRIRQEIGQINGIALTTTLGDDPATRGIPVVIITTSVLPQDRSDAEAAGSDAYLLLPTTPEDLVREVEAVLRQRSPRTLSPRMPRAERTRRAKDEIV